jgi:NAD(P) transhydrogenase
VSDRRLLTAGIPHFDVIVIGSGPAGHKAAIQAAKLNRSALLIEREVSVGGACVHRGTIPSKTLREAALAITGFKARTGSVIEFQVREDLQVASLMTRMEQVVRGHEQMMGAQLKHDRTATMHGRARFVDAHHVEVETVDGRRTRCHADFVIIATGSTPRTPADVPIDHERILDSDSILSMTYLPKTLTVLGAGVIAAEYASIFAALGTRVTMIDRGPRPLGFLDAEIADVFVAAFHRMGSRYLGGRKHVSVAWDEVEEVVTVLDDGSEVRSEKLLCCLGRVANLAGLDIEKAGLTATERGLIAVDADCRTPVPNVYAAGDVIGPPSLASSSAEQGRRAVCHMFGVTLSHGSDVIPAGIFTIPEMSQVGLTEAQATTRYGACLIGRAEYADLARGKIAALEEGLLKLVADPGGRKLLGVQIVGEGAAELIHVGQQALIHGADVDGFVDNIFNFPTLAEAYRVAALDIVRQRRALFPAGVPGEQASAPVGCH